MLKNKCFLVSILILFILSIGFVSASADIHDDSNQDACLESSDIVSADESLDLSSSADSENFNPAKEEAVQFSSDALHSGDVEELLTATVKPSGKTFNDIQNAVNNANANDVIELDGTYTSLGKKITVKKTLTFNGVNGATLDGKKLSGIFYIPSAVTVTFKNIKFVNSHESAISADSDGYVDKVKINLVIDNCSFSNNFDDYEGGAIKSISEGLCKISNSNFTSNYVRKDGSAGGAIYAYNIDLANCNFLKNSAEYDGGAIFCEKSLNIDGCTFKENFANSGGAIYGEFLSPDSNVEEGSKFNIKNSNFISNYLKSPKPSAYSCEGGAIYGHEINVFNCVFKQNSATLNGGKGGAICGVNIDVKDSVFESNIANYAGAIMATRSIGEDSYVDGVLKINNCSFISNNEAAIRACKAIVDYGSSTKVFNNKTLDNSLNTITFFKTTANKLVTSYYSGKTIKIKVLTTPSGKPAKYLRLLVIAKSSKKKYKIAVKTNSKGIATLKASRLNAGYYKIYVYETFCIPGSDPGDERYVKLPGVLKKTTLKVTKAKTIVKAPKVKFKYKKSKYFKVTLKNKESKKAMTGIKLKLKVYTGKKFKTYKVKTKKKGIAKFNTKKLKRGNHKVKILSENKNVRISKTSSIRIR